jgi:hypothetical protein
MPNSQLGGPEYLSVWYLTLDLSGLGVPASSYSTFGLTLEIIGYHKPNYHDKAQVLSVGHRHH